MGNDLWYLFRQLDLYWVVLAVVYLWVSEQMLGVGPLVAYVAAPSLICVAYTLDRRKYDAEDEVNAPFRVELVERYSSYLRGLEALALVCFYGAIAYHVATGSSGALQALWVIVLSHIPVGVLFAYSELKGFFAVDSIAVGFGWAYLLTVYPVVFSPESLPTEAILVTFGMWFILYFGFSEYGNIFDIEGDRANGNLTVAARLGVQGAYGLFTCIISVAVFLAFYGGGSGAAAALVVSIVGFHVMVTRDGKPDT